MDNDDIPVGRVLSRREALRVLTLASAGLLSGSARPASAGMLAGGVLPACVVRPELEEGPFFADQQLQRSDIRSDPADRSVREGVPLALAFTVSQIGAGGCAPLPGAMVDIWQCDAVGEYPVGGAKFLRGYQVTDAKGVARFTTIYPGWYQGRTVHVHFKIRTATAAIPAYEFTSQLFFDDALTDQVHARQPYARKGQRTLRNAGDRIFSQSGGQLQLALNREGEGYGSVFDIGLDLTNSAIGRPDGGGGRGPGGRGRG